MDDRCICKDRRQNSEPRGWGFHCRGHVRVHHLGDRTGFCLWKVLCGLRRLNLNSLGLCFFVKVGNRNIADQLVKNSKNYRKSSKIREHRDVVQLSPPFIKCRWQEL